MKNISVSILRILAFAGMLLLATCQKDEDNKPVIVSLAPESGKPGEAVAIGGTSLSNTKRVLFGNIEAVVAVSMGNTVTTIVPHNLPAGTVQVTVETDAGTSNALPFQVIIPLPEITAITPDKGASAMFVTLTGKNLSAVKEITFGDQKVTVFDIVSDTELVVKVPANLPLGATTVTAITQSGVSEEMSFTVVAPLSITSFTPPAGSPGSRVYISGTNLKEITGVYFVDVAATTFEVKNVTLIEAVVPIGVKTGKLKVTGAGGEAISAADFVVKGAPAISSVTPVLGTTGTGVTLTGENFNLPGVKVYFGSVPAIIISVSDTEIKTTVPVGAVTAPLTVQTDAGSSSNSTTFSIIGAPTITMFSPSSGLPHTTVTVSGTNFLTGLSVKVGSKAADPSSIIVNSMTSLTITIPDGATSGPMSVTTPAGTGVSAATFTVLDPALVLTFAPTGGAVGKSIDISGVNFDNTTTVTFNTTPALPSEIVVNSSTSLSVKVPAGATTGFISVTTPLGKLLSNQAFTVIQPPAITSVFPTSGAVATTARIYGSNFDNATVALSGVPIDPSYVVVNSSSVISLTIPPGATSGRFTVTTEAGSASSPLSFAVSLPPTITSFPPTAIIGATVTITGTNFTGTSSVLFNGVAAGASNFLVASPTSITAKVPVGATDGPITVITSAGTATSVQVFTVLFPPVIISFSPSSASPGSVLTITGSNFYSSTGTVTVLFGGSGVATGTIISPNSISVTVPNVGSGSYTIAVGQSSGITYSSMQFIIP